MPGQGDGARGATLRRQLVAAATERLGYKAAALFFALVLWLVASVEEPTEEVVPVRLTATLDSSIALVGDRPQLHALVVGRSREVFKLFDRPPVIRRAFGAETPAQVRLQLLPGDVDLPPGVEATVRDVQPRAVVLRFATVRPREIVDTLVESTRVVPAAPALEPLAVPPGTAFPGESVRAATPAAAAVPDSGARGAPPENHNTAAAMRARHPHPAGRPDSLRPTARPGSRPPRR